VAVDESSDRFPADPRADGPRASAARVERSDRSRWNWLLLLPLLVLLPPLYNKATPTLFDIPFFYWFQLAWILVGVTCTAIVYRKTRG
jgi:uncharacterized protein DUF3311